MTKDMIFQNLLKIVHCTGLPFKRMNMRQKRFMFKNPGTQYA